MSHEPPDDGQGPDGPDAEDPVLDDVLDQLDAALTEAGVTDPAMKAALSENLKAALGKLGELGEVDLTVDVLRSGQAATGEEEEDDPGDDHAGPPEVTVVDGGRQRGQPRVPHPRPELRVAGGPPEPPDEEPRRGVGVVRGRRLGQLGRQGRIAVTADGRQAVYRGSHPHPYRVLCDEGRLAVSVDGVTVETLQPGQSLDVEGTVIVVLAADEAPATGAYARL